MKISILGRKAFIYIEWYVFGMWCFAAGILIAYAVDAFKVGYKFGLNLIDEEISDNGNHANRRVD